MSEVKRFSAPFSQVNESSDGLYIHADDYDTAQSELAALREENERLKSESFEELYNAAIDERDALRGELAASRLNEYNAQVNMSEQHDKLTAAEQRNAELERLVSEAHAWVDQNNFGGCDAYALRDRLAAALKPTESGASE